MDLVMTIGFTAGALTTIAFWPQFQRTWTTKSADVHDRSRSSSNPSPRH